MLAAWRAALYAVANRRSADRPAIPASARSRATSARMSSSSFFDVRCAWTSWLPNSFFQVTLASFQELLGTGQYGGDEMILRCRLFSELIGGITRDVDFPAETFLNRPNHRREFSQADGTNDEHVHIAERMFAASSDRAVRERAVDPSGEWFQGV